MWYFVGPSKVWAESSLNIPKAQVSASIENTHLSVSGSKKKKNNPEASVSSLATSTISDRVMISGSSNAVLCWEIHSLPTG